MTIQDISNDHRIVEAMSKYGGSFAKAIAKGVYKFFALNPPKNTSLEKKTNGY